MPYNQLTGFAWALGTDFVIETVIYTSPAHTACIDASLYDAITFRVRAGVASGAAVITKTLDDGIAVVGTFNADPAQNTQQVRITVAAADQVNLNPGQFFWTLEREQDGLSVPLFGGPAIANATP